MQTFNETVVSMLLPLEERSSSQFTELAKINQLQVAKTRMSETLFVQIPGCEGSQHQGTQGSESRGLHRRLFHQGAKHLHAPKVRDSRIKQISLSSAISQDLIIQ